MVQKALFVFVDLVFFRLVGRAWASVARTQRTEVENNNIFHVSWIGMSCLVYPVGLANVTAVQGRQSFALTAFLSLMAISGKGEARKKSEALFPDEKDLACTNRKFSPEAFWG